VGGHKAKLNLMTKKSTHLTVLAFLLLIQAGFAQTFNKAKMDSLFDVLAANNKVMMSIAVSRNGQPLYSRAIGYSWLNPTQSLANTKTRYRIGSITKVFTATMIFQLIEAGKLQLTTPLAQFYPGLPNATKITIAQMLNHSSGIHSFTNDNDFPAWLDKKMTPKQLTDKMMKADFEPGAKHQYSNSNFILLGYIIEKLDRVPYPVALKQRITSKIGLKDTYYGGKITAASNEANSYQWQGEWKPDTESDMSIPGGAGAIVSNPNDLVKFMNALFAGKLVNQTSLTQMTTIQNGYGMNLFPYAFKKHNALGHTGSIDGFRSQAVYFPQEKVAVAFVANGINTNLNNVFNGAVDIAFNEPYTIPSYKTITLKAEDLDQYLGVYTSTKVPLEITVTKKGNVLMGQAAGQSQFELSPFAKHEFTVDAIGANLLFDPANQQMTLIQGGGKFLFNKKK
jgi:D-alanyl-D-alanine carboxypeptidase